jgi:hypothetical protein
MSHICANDEYRSQVGATNRSETSSFVTLVSSLSRQFVRIGGFNLAEVGGRVCAFRFVTVYTIFHVVLYALPPLAPEISKVTAHERIQHLYPWIKIHTI